MGCASYGPNKKSAEQAQKNFGNKYKLLEKIGEGVFGQVRVVQNRESGEQLAVKIIRRIVHDDHSGQTKDYTAHVQLEIDVWKKLGTHSNCVELVDSFMGRTLCFIVMERCKCEILEGWEQRSESGTIDVKTIFNEMIRGVEHVHRQNVVHRDIKPENYLWGGPDGNAVKLADFGLAAVLPKSDLLKGVSGTAPYMSPEMLQGTGYDGRTDVWSVGCTIYLMVYASFPYGPEVDTPKKMKAAILAGTPPPTYKRPSATGKSNLDTDQTQTCKDFIEGLIVRDFKVRPTATEALEMLVKRVDGKKVTSCDLSVAVRRARLATHEFKIRPDPTVTKEVDDLLRDLAMAGGFGLRRSFSWNERHSEEFDTFAGLPATPGAGENQEGGENGNVSPTAEPPMDNLESLERKTRRIRTAPAGQKAIGQQGEPGASAEEMNTVELEFTRGKTAAS
eukprot:TRINITY_DN75674_c0_g1_i1.p1 TRINITY_DN75674_c0_g1~~TRINITY_DN75674_c0_g1_i1.p1  ORF type:complete len:448 (-),score=72.80 TRINITY_DN75674_c0_g1_i1:199-1542(-)